jgi:hypothetical protein
MGIAVAHAMRCHERRGGVRAGEACLAPTSDIEPVPLRRDSRVS